jgi:GTPase SAR1 family protein
MVAGTPVYIAVLGLVGAGKSTFINQVIEKKQEEENVPIRTGLFDCMSDFSLYIFYISSFL